MSFLRAWPWPIAIGIFGLLVTVAIGPLVGWTL